MPSPADLIVLSVTTATSHTARQLTPRALALGLAWRTLSIGAALWITSALLGADTGTGPFKGGVQQSIPVRNPQPDRDWPAQGKGEAVALAAASSSLAILLS